MLVPSIRFTVDNIREVMLNRKLFQIAGRKGVDRPLPTYQPLLRVIVAVSAGIGIDRFCQPSPWIWLVGLCLTMLAWFTLFRHRRWMISSALLLLCLLATGALWHNLNWNWIGSRDIGSFADLDAKPVVLRGRIAGQPRWIAADDPQMGGARHRGIRSRMQLQVDALRDRNQFRSATGNVELFVDGRVQDLFQGDRIEVAGRLTLIRPVSNPGGFDLPRFFRGRRTLCWIHADFPENLKPLQHSPTGPARQLSVLRARLDALLWKFLSDETAPLASAMLLGNRDQLDRKTRESFLLSGTVHLLAISGLHVGILAGLILFLPRLGLLSRRSGLLATMLFVACYAGLVEFRPPVTRAAILICVFCYCHWIGRTPFSFNSLALAALVVLAFNPAELFGTGAQLSFLAVASLVYGRHWISLPSSKDPIDRLIDGSLTRVERFWRAIRHGVYSAFSVSVVIWLFAAPAVATQFHILAPVAMLVNPLLLVPLTTGLVCGLGVLVFGSWLPTVGHLLAAGCEVPCP